MKYKIKTILLLVALAFVVRASIAQTVLEPYLGYSVDLGNKELFSQVNLGTHLALINKPRYKMLLSLQGSLPVFSHAAVDQAFSVNPNLPLSTTAKRKSAAYAFSLALSHRFRLKGDNKNAFFGIVHFGAAEHSVKVRYVDYDKEQYTVLNSKTNYKKFGVFFGAGLHYERNLTDGRFFVQLIANTPLLNLSMSDQSLITNKYNYTALAPIGFNVGYSFDIGKKKTNVEKSNK